MDFLVAPCAYKGTYNPIELAQAIEEGIQRLKPKARVLKLPLADGGDGTIEALNFLLGGQLIEQEVLGPSTNKVKANWLKLKVSESDKEIAVIELAQASGINHLSPEELDPMRCHTRGVGQVLVSCLNEKINQVFITVGGSASTDGGTGILSELGVIFRDKNNNALMPCGENLARIESIETNNLDHRLAQTELNIVTDVVNPLYGENGAAYIYGPQKGANEAQVKALDKGLKSYSKILIEATDKDLSTMKGAGAAGGVPYGLGSVTNAKIVHGFNWFSDLVKLEQKLESVDVVITAEGFLDSQTLSGKAIGELAKLCKKHKKQLWVLPANYQDSINWQDYGIAQVAKTASRNSASLEDVTNETISLIKKVCKI